MNTQSKNIRFKLLLGVSLSFGFLLFTAILLLCSPLKFYRINLYSIIYLFSAVCTGFLLRVVRRKFFFGKSITFHRALSYEVIVQFIQIISPFFPRRAFEAEFLELNDKVEHEKVLSWLSLRSLSLLFTSILSLIFISYFFFPKIIFFLIAIAIFILIYNKRIFANNCFAFLMMIIFAFFIWGLELFFFVMASRSFLPDIKKIIVIYMAFTGLYEFSPAPFALGIAELPVLFLGKNFIEIILIFHFFRLFLPLSFSLLYLKRYKFSASDFFSPRLIEVLSKRRIYQENALYSKNQIEKIAIVIPAYNEEKRILNFLESIKDYSQQKKNISAVIVVDDGSNDRTYEIVKEFSNSFPLLQIIKNKKNEGKGFSVRSGILYALNNCEFDAILYADADGATPIEELDNLLSFFVNNTFHIAIGSRKSSKAKRTELRALTGKIFYKIVNLLAIPGINDSQCGFKLFTRDSAKKIITKCLENTWAIDVEILYIAQMLGYNIAQFEVKWTEKAGSKLNLIKDSLKMLIAVFRIRSRHGGLMKDA